MVKLFGRFGRGQTADKIQKDLVDENGKTTPIAYRPFDYKWTYYSGNSCGWVFWPREKKTMGHLLHEPTSPIGENIGLVYPKGTNNFWDGAFISNTLLDSHFIDYPGRSIGYVAPLYIAPNDLVKEWTPNFNQEQLDKLTQNLKEKPTAIEIFDYCYGVLYDPIYREKYNEFLKRDFPKVPIIENEAILETYKSAGERLRKLHLMQTDTKFDLTIEGDNLNIEAIKYIDGKLQINKETKIIGIPQEVWSYYIGGYQVIDKWFKSHKGEKFVIENFIHIQKVVGIIAETIKIQNEFRNIKNSKIEE